MQGLIPTHLSPDRDGAIWETNQLLQNVCAIKDKADSTAATEGDPLANWYVCRHFPTARGFADCGCKRMASGSG